MKRSMLLASLIALAMLTGCATSSPESRGYSNEERFELSLEALNRQALPYEQYMQARARLVRGQDAEASNLAQQGASVSPEGRDS
ncbi:MULTISPECIES: hypothetical protein [Pseudomonas]|uniref:DUF4398 domain-containing protein n=1 Tax=Pseudomonas quercus TaxID=2722792 RepID=A0ABX0YEQ7_9PSED|nr:MULTISPECIES: hypothetical protein [Pseudomonas]MBF7143449.1 hypothetical protein [Pseudomonas sp. LY10J]NJP01752.1 hypothetical protein [Pseudomonas quercus]